MPILFADDTNLFKNGKDIGQLQSDIHEELCKISKWLKVNKLSFNIKKDSVYGIHKENNLSRRFTQIIIIYRWPTDI